MYADIRPTGWMLSLRQQVFGDNIPRDAAKRNRAVCCRQNCAESPRGIGRSRCAASSGRTTESTRRPFFVVFAASTYIENRERVSIAVYLDVFLLENIEENIKRTDLRLFCCVSLHRELRNESNRC